VRARQNRRIARAFTVVAKIMARHGDELGYPGARATISAAQLTSTGMAVVVVSKLGDRPGVVIKLPMTTDAVCRLEREDATLAQLHANSQLGGWRNLLPVPRLTGTLAGQRYRIDDVVPGHPHVGPPRSRGTYTPAVRDAAAAISVLHRATRRTAVCDSETAELWIEDPMRALEAHLGSRTAQARHVARLRHELREALLGQTFSTSWVHGDYWLGNLLFAGPAASPGAVTGIVDWDAASPLDLPLHDVLHLLLYTRRLRSGRELGHIVRDQLATDRWSLEERELLDEYGIGWDHGPLTHRHAVLLYWLRHVAQHSRQHNDFMGRRYWWWQRCAILPVLASL
jgi:aminoglycoside phosphotransferase (APT) family kinase protein